MGKIFYIMGKSASGKDRIYSILSKDESLGLKRLVLYTTRPIRAGEENGREYYFTDENRLEEFRKTNRLIESRAYHTVHGIWTYLLQMTDRSIHREQNYLGSELWNPNRKMKEYYGEETVCPIYIQVEDGERLQRALIREKQQENPRYAEMCAGFWQIRRIFRRRISLQQVSGSGSKMMIWIIVSEIL